MIFTDNDNRCVVKEIHRVIVQASINLNSLFPKTMNSTDQLITRDTGKSLDQACDDLEAAVTNHQFGVMTKHDLKQTMAKKGVDFPRECRVFEVCNPHQAKKVLEANIEISTALPCRISVYEEAGRVHFSTIRPIAMLGMFPAAGAESVAGEVEETMTAILEEAAASATG